MLSSYSLYPNRVIFSQGRDGKELVNAGQRGIMAGLLREVLSCLLGARLKYQFGQS